jgi:general secretion pathway protein I
LIRTGRQDGFTLLETLIAFLIVSIALGIAAQTVSIATRSFRAAAGLRQAELLAREVQLQLEGEGSTAPKGTRGTMRWRVAAMAVAPSAEAGLVTLHITESSGRHYSFLLFKPGRVSSVP